jgi:PAS domain S-box-containing protein
MNVWSRSKVNEVSFEQGVSMVSKHTTKAWFSPEQSVVLQDFWQVYTTHYEEILKTTMDAARENPHFGPIVSAMTPEATKKQSAESVERLRLAILEGQWEPYEAALRRDGAAYAKMGVAYSAWSRIIRVYLEVLYPLMVETFSTDLKRLAKALIGFQALLDQAMTIIVEEYLETKEALLRESEQNLAITLDSIGDAVLTTDSTGRIQRLNPVAENLTGWKLEECRGKPLVEIFCIENEETRAPAVNPVERVLKEGTVVGLANHTVLTSRNGARYPIVDSAAPIRGADGEVRGVVLVFRDMTEECRAKEALTKSERTLAATLNSIHEGVSILDNDGRVLFSNRTAHQINALLSYNEDQTNEQWSSNPNVFYTDGKTPCPPEDHPIARAFRGEMVRDFDLYYLTSAVPEGGIYINLNTCPILDQEDVQLGIVSTFRDISHRRRLEEAQAESRRSQEESRLKSEFLANMSHELRTPLNSVIGFAELLHDGEVGSLSPKQKEFLGDILTSGKHLLRLINSVLDLSKVEAGKIELHPEPVELKWVIGEVTSVLHPTAHSKNMRMEVSLDPEVRNIVLDIGRLKQVLYNYLSNALKFTPAGGRVKIRTLAEGSEFFRLEVEDNGIGIAEKDISKLFIEFQQLDVGEAQKYGGTGLGLALTKRLVEAQGGSVGVSSALHKGSTFFAVLPRRGVLTVLPPKPLVIEGESPEASRILVVEEDPVDREKLVRFLVKAGYAVETATTGRQAIHMSQQKSYDAVTLDLRLPDTNGLEVLRAIRADQKIYPVVMFTIVAGRVIAGFAVHDTLTKPINGQSLLASLQRAEITPEKSNKILVIDDDASSLKLMRTTLVHLGYRALCYQSAEVALLSTSKEKISAVILDLMMPGLNGFQFLARFREEPNNASIPVLLWTNKGLSHQEQIQLYESAQTVIRKGVGTSKLANALGDYLSKAKSKEK